MQHKKQYISFFLLLLYVVSFSMIPLPAMAIGEIQFKKECPNKNKKAKFVSEVQSSKSTSAEKIQLDLGKQNVPASSAKVSLCSQTTVFIVKESDLMLRNTFVQERNLGFFPKIYESPYLSTLESPPKHN